MKHSLALISWLAGASLASAQSSILWQAFHDYRPSTLTHPNATTFDLRVVDEGGALRNIETGEDLPATVRVVVEGDATPDDFGAISAPVNPGSPADRWFKGYVDIGGPDNPGLPGVRNSASTRLILVFENLDPARRYHFRGTVARAGGYNDRWSYFGIADAESFVSAHEDGSVNQNLFTEATFAGGDLQSNEVALNSGDNKAGSLVGWDNIDPGADGSFQVYAAQYVGPAPFGNPSAAPYGYAFNALYLAQVESTGTLRITENPSNQNVPAGGTATFRVVATSTQPITYQWERSAPGATTFTAIPGASLETYTTPVLTAADSGSRFQVRLASGGREVTTAAVELLVDASIPALAGVTGGVNRDSVLVSFSEPMRLGPLAGLTNYALSGGLTLTSATVLDPRRVRLLTSSQTSGQTYTLSVNNLADLAGNPVPAGTSRSFVAFQITTNAVGVELWRTVGGSTVQNLRDDPRYPSQPDEDYSITSLDSLLVSVLTESDNNTYGGRFRAWLTPEESAEYEFFLRADDQGELRVSSDDSFALLDDPDFVLNELPTASDTTAGDPFQEPGIDSSASAPIQLVAGRRYALQVIWKEANGGDHAQVAWRKVGDFTPADQLTPIPGRFLSYYGPAATPPTENPTVTRVVRQGDQIVIEWSGAMLQSSTDLRTWTDESGLGKPATVAPSGNRFYRARN